MQHIIVRTAKLTSPVDDGWRTNGAGFHFNHKFGFGRLDADAMVEMAKTWTSVPAQRICTGAASIEERSLTSQFQNFAKTLTFQAERLCFGIVLSFLLR